MSEIPSRELTVSHLGEKEHHLQNAIFGGYVSSLEGTLVSDLFHLRPRVFHDWHGGNSSQISRPSLERFATHGFVADGRPFGAQAPVQESLCCCTCCTCISWSMNEYDTYIYMYLSFTVTGFYIYNHMRIRCDILYCEVQMKSNPSAEAAVSLWQLLGSGSVVATPSNLLRKKHLVSHHGGGGDWFAMGLQHVFLLTKISWLSWLSQFFVFFCCANMRPCHLFRIGKNPSLLKWGCRCSWPVSCLLVSSEVLRASFGGCKMRQKKSSKGNQRLVP